MDRDTITAEDLRNALIELTIRSTVFAHMRGMPEARGNLRCAISHATALVKSPIAETATGATAIPKELWSDPEALFSRFVEAGGDPAALEAAIRKVARDIASEPGDAQRELLS